LDGIFKRRLALGRALLALSPSGTESAFLQIVDIESPSSDEISRFP
jgi:hypothetical protein